MSRSSKISSIRNLFIILITVASLVFIAHTRVVGSAVWGDGQYYFSFLHSIVTRGSLNTDAELVYFGNSVQYTPNGYAVNKYSIGPVVLWIPFYTAYHLMVSGIQFLGFTVSADGYSLGYQLVVGLSSVFYGMLGLYLCLKTIRKFYPPIISVLATVGIWVASNLFFYTSVDTINSHPLSFFAASLIVYILCSNIKKVLKTVLLGLSLGLLILIRNQDAIYFLPILFIIGLNLQSFLIGLIAFLIFIPQLLIWYTMYGQIASPYLLGGEKFYWNSPHFFDVLFSSQNGLFYVTPVLLIAVLGLVLLSVKKINRLAGWGIVLLIIQTYIIGSWHYWWGGASYGGRMYISLMPFFILGLAEIFGRRYVNSWVKIGILAGLSLVNIISIILFLLNSK